LAATSLLCSINDVLDISKIEAANRQPPTANRIHGAYACGKRCYAAVEADAALAGSAAAGEGDFLAATFFAGALAFFFATGGLAVAVEAFLPAGFLGV
jgi:hypothetical protein